MVRIAVALSILVLSAVRVVAAPDLMVMGDALVAKYDTRGPRGGLIEFIPADESVETWTQLVGYRADLAAAPDAAGAAAAVAGRARQRYPGSNPRVLTRGDEAIVELGAVGPDGVIEFDVFRYAPGPDGRGIVSIQYARRFRGLALDGVRERGVRWTAGIARFNMDRVRAAFLRRPQG